MNLKIIFINPLDLLSGGAPTLKYGDVNTVTPSPGEVKGLMKLIFFQKKKRMN